jgi:serine/threonine protein kinase
MLDTTRTQTFDCPSPDDLSAFLDGRLPRLRLESVAAHVERYDACAEKLSTFPGDADTLVRELRTPTESEPIAPEEASRASVIAASVGVPAAQSNAHGRSPRPGTLLGPYELVELLGEGGMGQVWRARHQLLGRDVAVKLIHPGRIGDSVSLSRFQREIKLLARLDHPNVVRAEHADVIDGTHVLVMEYVPGVSLTDHVRTQGVMPVEKACEALRQAALALQCAHEKGLVHRDVKPSNLLLTPDGTVKLLDLGLARAAGAPAADELTASGQVMGTFDYMAPEQWDDSHAVDGRADVYSLGCTAYFLLTGRAPFAEAGHNSRLSKMKAHALLPPPSLKAARPDVPDALADVVARMLAKAPEDRIQTPGEVAKLLETIQAGGKVKLGPPPAPQIRVGRDEDSHTEVTPPQPKRGSALPWVLGGLGLVMMGCLAVAGVGLLGGVMLWSGSSKPNQDRQGPVAPDHAVNGGFVDEPKRNPDPQPEPPPQPAVGSLIKSFRVILAREGEGERGEMGDVVFDVRENDSAWIDVKLKQRAYAYLIAFNPDGSEQLLWPGMDGIGDDGKIPEAVEAFRHPPARLEKSNFGFTDGPGLQAFVLVTSAERLPSYKLWKQERTAIWGRVTPERAWGTWHYDGNTLRLRERKRTWLVPPPLSREQQVGFAAATLAVSPNQGIAGVPWEAVRRGCVDTPAARYQELLAFFKKRPGVEVHAWGCAVAPAR